jgi:hypothetical protein
MLLFLEIGSGSLLLISILELEEKTVVFVQSMKEPSIFSY